MVGAALRRGCHERTIRRVRLALDPTSRRGHSGTLRDSNRYALALVGVIGYAAYKREQQLANAKRPEKGGDSVGPIQAAEEGMPLAESDSDPHSPKGCGQKDGAAPLTE